MHHRRGLPPPELAHDHSSALVGCRGDSLNHGESVCGIGGKGGSLELLRLLVRETLLYSRCVVGGSLSLDIVLVSAESLEILATFIGSCSTDWIGD